MRRVTPWKLIAAIAKKSFPNWETGQDICPVSPAPTESTRFWKLTCSCRFRLSPDNDVTRPMLLAICRVPVHAGLPGAGCGRLSSNWGFISHRDIEGKLPGQRFRTSTGTEFLLKRPTLEEYVTMMKRGPTISYPKDTAAMLLMMDVNPGDTVLEAGSGSGGLSLFLSRAVGAAGRVYSFDVRADHHAIAKKNFQRWRDAWEHRSREPWPENVTFINKDIASALPDIKPVAFDSVALDMLNPQVALPTILPNLKQGAVCAVYLANITQVIDLLEGIRSCQLSMVCEKIVEVSWKDWLVAPSVRKDGSVSQRLKPENNVESFQEGVTPDEHQESDRDGMRTSIGYQINYVFLDTHITYTC
uniref:tRNA (adenine(58)-N(1))-methyltransferase n=1 Tax=Leptobrachium leishanense TaxID=445787 RepID=A0A8C5MZX4_9ANUR